MGGQEAACAACPCFTPTLALPRRGGGEKTNRRGRRKLNDPATIQGGLDALFRDNPQVFVAGDLLWYPVEGHPEIILVDA